MIYIRGPNYEHDICKIVTWKSEKRCEGGRDGKGEDQKEIQYTQCYLHSEV